MSLSTLTRYLRLKIKTDLALPASQNLARLDALGNTFAVDENDKLEVRSRGNLVLRPEASEVGGDGSGGEVHIGTSSQPVAVKFFASSFVVAGGAGSLLTEDSLNTVTNKSLSGNNNLFSNIGYSALNLSASIKNSDIASDAAIADTKLATISTAGKVNFSSLTGNPSGTVFPSYSGNDGKYLKLVDGALSWETAASGGGMEVSKTDWTSGSSLTVTHNFATTDVLVSMWDLGSGEPVYTDTVTRNSNSVELSVPSGTVPNYRVIVVKA